MNVWHFQCVRNAGSAPKQLLNFCETTTQNLVDAMQPQNVLCLGRPSFAALAPKSARRVEGARSAEVAQTGGRVLVRSSSYRLVFVCRRPTRSSPRPQGYGHARGGDATGAARALGLCGTISARRLGPRCDCQAVA